MVVFRQIWDVQFRGFWASARLRSRPLRPNHTEADRSDGPQLEQGVLTSRPPTFHLHMDVSTVRERSLENEETLYWSSFNITREI